MIKARNVEQLALALAQCSALAHLDLGFNQIGDDVGGNTMCDERDRTASAGIETRRHAACDSFHVEQEGLRTPRYQTNDGLQISGEAKATGLAVGFETLEARD